MLNAWWGRANPWSQKHLSRRKIMHFMFKFQVAAEILGKWLEKGENWNHLARFGWLGIWVIWRILLIGFPCQSSVILLNCRYQRIVYKHWTPVITCACKIWDMIRSCEWICTLGGFSTNLFSMSQVAEPNQASTNLVGNSCTSICAKSMSWRKHGKFLGHKSYRALDFGGSEKLTAFSNRSWYRNSYKWIYGSQLYGTQQKLASVSRRYPLKFATATTLQKT